MKAAARRRRPRGGGARKATLALGTIVGLLAAALTAGDGAVNAAPPEADASGVQAAVALADRPDLSLTDVTFVDAQHGWAVGDMGTILATNDGGQTWTAQHSGVACRLESVFFLDNSTGWAVGSTIHPYLHSTSGTVLATHDGGATWSHNAALSLPALKQVRFFNAQHGWAAGAASAMHPSGLFITDSGGRGWKAAPSDWPAGLRSADLLTPSTGAAVGTDGTAAVIRAGGVDLARTPGFGLRRFARVRLTPGGCGWAVGDGGLALRSRDQGTTWQPPASPLPAGAELFDFAAIAVRGNKVWLAGSPGSRIFFTADAGQTWTAAATSQNTPINALTFVDDEHGWAVGELGNILATADGGHTWRLQRCGGRRVALLCLMGRADGVPWEALARLAGDEGYLSVVHLLGRSELEVRRPPRAALDDRLRAAVLAAGGSGGTIDWRFPLGDAAFRLPAEQVAAGWCLPDQPADVAGGPWNELVEHAITQIRLWRPDVVITGDAEAGEQQLFRQAVAAAVAGAAEPSAADRWAAAGLAPWAVKKLYGSTGPNSRGTLTVNAAELGDRLGQSLGDVGTLARALMEGRFRRPPATTGFALLGGTVGQAGTRDDFFSGIHIEPGGDARRPWVDPPAETLDRLRRLGIQRRNARAILERMENDRQGGVELIAQIESLTRGLLTTDAVQILYSMAESQRSLGRWQAAAETYEALVERYPDEPLCRPALCWLAAYYGSSELARVASGDDRIEQPAEGEELPAAGPAAARRERLGQIAAMLGERYPDLFVEPQLGFARAACDRRHGEESKAKGFYLSQSRSLARDGWQISAVAEQWLSQRTSLPPRPVLACRWTSQKPRLDGCLDDAVWNEAPAAELRSPRGDDGAWPALVMLAHDDQFLYLATECGQAAGATYAAAQGVRPRDADLSDRDRIDVYLDIDRDYATWYRLSVDYRGWTGDECWGETSWNPQWFVAAAAAGGRWTVEAAIPLESLSRQAIKSGDVWAVGLQRIVPGVGGQGWNERPGGTVRPHHFGYLAFEEAPQ